MKIGITCYPSAGGSGVMATELGKRLATMGHEIHFITSALPVRLRGFNENIYFHEVVPESYPLFQYPPYDLSLATKMHDVAVLHQLEVLHVHYAIPHAVCAYLAREMLKPRGITTVTTLHGTDITLIGVLPSFYRVTRFSIEQSDGVTAVSEWLRRQTIESFHIENGVEVIPNFVDTKVFKPACREKPKICLAPGGDKIILHISNFRPVKNVEAVIRVFAALRARHACRLVLVGEGPERTRAERLAAELGVSDKVVFRGNEEYIEDILPSADLFLLPSHHESFGLVALEAMSAGVPVVATNQGGTVEVIEDGVSGFLRSPDDLDGMVEAASRILDDPAFARTMSEAARESAVRKFDVEHVVHRYVEFYEKTRSK